MATAGVKRLTLAEFEALPERPGGYELDRGELIEMSGPKLRHTLAAKALARELSAACREPELGEVFVEAAFLLDPQRTTIRQPDVAFVQAERLRGANLDDWLRGAPDLAVEIVSPSDSAASLLHKTRQYLEAGATAVWIVYLDEREVHVHRPDRSIQVLRESDRLAAPELFPDWSSGVGELLR